LRALQTGNELGQIVDAARRALRAQPSARPPLLLKVSPDLAAEERAEVARIALEHNIDGLIIANTTVQRPPVLRSAARSEQGGLSGAPLGAIALEALRAFRSLTGGRLPLIGTGGIASAQQAYARIRAGASAVQIYTALIYEGPGLIARIKRDLAALLRRDGFASVAAAVGSEDRTN
jgi:dihydroorotate dehydrogenase